MINGYVYVMKIFIFGLVIAFFIFKIGFWSKAYSNFVELGPMQRTIDDISSAECREILNSGNIMEYPGDRDDFWTIIYDYKQYFVQQTKDPFSQRETYTCHGAQELIPFTE